MRVAEPDIAACERNQRHWYEAQATVTGGARWRSGDLEFIAPGPDGDVMLAFPTRIEVSDAEAGLERAWSLGYRSIGAWLRAEGDGVALAALGFESGWQPHWMAARLADIPPVNDRRIQLEDATPEYDGRGRAMLTLTEERPRRAWHAVARIDGRIAGRAWIYSDGETAGVYDMDVWPRFRRQGIGRGLLATLATAARDAGHRWAVLNATPDGERLYRGSRFSSIGHGATWWKHREDGRGGRI